MAKSIMIQGTMSNVGKSIVAAGLCRIFKQDGYRVAPFKSQNMALNSYITSDGLEMGRAQVVQAQACGIEPTVNMNPILLKPTSDMGSQVIINGSSIGNMSASEYFRHKKDYVPVIKKAYDELDREYDIVVIEGAGSPAEINLKQDDIVNMGMAKLADAPVLLVGDIDRGGVFAQLAGTVMLLEEDERDRIKGLVINKFRGDATILEPGLAQLEDICGKPVLGVIPYATLDIDGEDSLADSLRRDMGTKDIDIAVIRLPRISNFTDFQALSMEPGVALRYVDRASKLGHPDVVIIPGTKSTIEDMKWLKTTGLETAIKRLFSENTLIFGICGGYQLLGEKISDTVGAENTENQTIAGMGLLPVITSFNNEKRQTRVETVCDSISGAFCKMSGKKITGYEIHMGATKTKDGNTLPNIFGRENVAGTYIHGIFDEPDIRNAFIETICDKKGIEHGTSTDITYGEYQERQYDLLADILRRGLDMDRIYEILGVK